MKIIELKVLGEKDKVGYVDYKALIKTIVQIPSDPRQGLNIDEVKKSVRVLDALEEAKDKLTLEDADYNLLRTKVNAFKFSYAHKNIVTFADDITGAKKS